MNDVTRSVPSLEAQSVNPVPTDNPSVPTEPENVQPTAPEAQSEPEAPSAAEQAAQSASDAAAQAQADSDAAREQASATLKALVKAFRSGERAYRTGLLEAGRLAAEYIAQRLALCDKRAAAVQAIGGALAAYASDSVDVNRLVRAWTAYRLLAVETGLTEKPAPNKAAPVDSVPYGHFRDAWSRLVERMHPDTVAEAWEFVPTVKADDARAAFRKAVESGLSREAVNDVVNALLGKPLSADKGAKGKGKASDATAQPANASAAATAETPALPTVDGSNPSAPGSIPASAPFVSTLPPNASVNPPKASDKPAPTVDAKPDDPEETALSIAELVEDSERPDDVVEKVCDLLVTSKKLSNPTKRALQAALMLMKRNASPSPATVATALQPTAQPAPTAAVA